MTARPRESLAELDTHLPEQVLIVIVGTEVTAHLPNREETVETGDHVTLVGSQQVEQPLRE